MSKLIALVATAVMVNGERTVIQPGKELPDLHPHDEHELLASGAAQDPEEVKALKAMAAIDKAEAAKDFKAARDRVQAKQASTEVDEATGEDEPATPAKAAKAAGKK